MYSTKTPGSGFTRALSHSGNFPTTGRLEWWRRSVGGDQFWRPIAPDVTNRNPKIELLVNKSGLTAFLVLTKSEKI
jgi:hypothetical protein